MPSRKRFNLMQSRDLSAFKWRSARPSQEATHVCWLCSFVKLVHFPSCKSNGHKNMTCISQTLIYQHETVTS